MHFKTAQLFPLLDLVRMYVSTWLLLLKAPRKTVVTIYFCSMNATDTDIRLLDIIKSFLYDECSKNFDDKNNLNKYVFPYIAYVNE